MNKKIISLFIILFRLITRFPSRILFGNLNKFHYNIIPYFHLFYWKLISKKDEFNKNGFIKINFNQKRELIEKIKSQFDKQIKDSSKIFYSGGDRKKISLKNPLEIKGILKLHDIFKDILNDYYEGNYKVETISCWRTMYDKSRENKKEDYIFSNYWHFDDFNCGNLKVFILMNEFTDHNSGSTKLINKRNTKFLTRSFKFLDTSISNFSLN